MKRTVCFLLREVSDQYLRRMLLRPECPPDLYQMVQKEITRRAEK